MDRFARIVIGYHGCKARFANDLLVGRKPIATWRQSQNAYDWLGSGIYFWEHSPTRALHWAEEQFRGRASVVGAVIQLGYCFDLLNEEFPPLLGKSFQKIDSSYRSSGKQLPQNHGREKKLRALDCAVINDCISNLESLGREFDTVRGAFLEGEPAFAGTTISTETHIQIAVRNIDCILGIFRPNLTESHDQ